METVFPYFLEAYCFQSLETEELPEAIASFKEGETLAMQEQLISELQQLLQNHKLSHAQQLIETYGSRSFSLQHTQQWLTYLLTAFQS
ncbi:hypothetical protein A374_06786 [Fictibacillus macauensis ZFHKF-1]|uniref:CdiI immunity protein domain-containing protein n=1 Tax=Fictibacillus macauensis ZFHKF-1 TaxID=1196324 RepID=I8UH97_9BACL|nr:hypothetical protein [Fictibacillus macauensis]EIT86285.1 hypothetical protein A374_06786 [Fictibacillus macauensis ZFHKF-1]